MVLGHEIAGTVEKLGADVVVGFKSGGLFIRTEGAPVAFVDTSVSWRGKLWVSHCERRKRAGEWARGGSANGAARGMNGVRVEIMPYIAH